MGCQLAPRRADVIWNNEGLALLVYQRVDGVEPHSEKDTYEAGRTRGDEGEGWGEAKGRVAPLLRPLYATCCRRQKVRLTSLPTTSKKLDSTNYHKLGTHFVIVLGSCQKSEARCSACLLGSS